MVDPFHLKHAKANRKNLIHELAYIPTDIQSYQKANKTLTKTEKWVGAFLQSCIRYGYVKSYRTQQIIKLGIDDKYIMADFFLHWPEAIIEVDGPEHNAKQDAWRDERVWELFAYKTLRVSNKDVTLRNKETRTKLVRELAAIEGLSPRKVTSRVKEYWANQKLEGFHDF